MKEMKGKILNYLEIVRKGSDLEKKPSLLTNLFAENVTQNKSLVLAWISPRMVKPIDLPAPTNSQGRDWLLAHINLLITNSDWPITSCFDSSEMGKFLFPW